LTAKILVEWVVFANVTLKICMDFAMSYGCDMPETLVVWCQLLVPFIDGWWSFCHFLLLLTFDMV
jgi:hypothetical protein